MGYIRSSRDQELVAGVPNVSNDKGKKKYESYIEKEQSKEPSGLKRSKKNGKGKTLCSYCGRGFHPESSCMGRTIDELALLLKKHNITIPASVRKADIEKKLKNMKRHDMH